MDISMHLTRIFFIKFYSVLITMAIFTASGEHGKKVNYSSCVTGLDTGVTCDLATFPSSRAKMIQEQDNYCCSLPLAFQEFGVCTENEDSDSGRRGRTRYNVPVCCTLIGR